MRRDDAKVSQSFAAGAPHKPSPLNFQKRGNNFSLVRLRFATMQPLGLPRRSAA
jgi:hypothetical protein